MLIGKFPRLLGISVHNKLVAEGFTGGYSTVTRELRTIRGPRFRAAEAVSMPIHTDPGEEAQFDFCDLSGWAQRWGWATPLWCFGMILSWSRWRMWWFTTSQDRHHTFEGIARFFDAAGGIPAAIRTDRMGALGRSQGQRFVLHPQRDLPFSTAGTTSVERDVDPHSIVRIRLDDLFDDKRPAKVDYSIGRWLSGPNDQRHRLATH